MSAKYLAGFAAVCGVVVAGLDYYQQAKASETGLGLKGYVASVSARVGISDSRLDAKAQPVQPEEPAAKTPAEETKKLVCTTIGTSKRCRSSG
ncbi:MULTISPECIES: hypothetical protein [Ruegeria]|uniref:hypothetical protein n=1 Tax=Ruegeria TaxID=97050 RepID=UPI001479F314|nr:MULTISPECIES: hypothetical protein [Ruegeria]NOC91498.1 hypothetical protein [Ruegeria sp. HKCCD6604]UUV05246.1 hypothetical protein NOR97_11480 [Ruegeria sp. YS9]